MLPNFIEKDFNFYFHSSNKLWVCSEDEAVTWLRGGVNMWVPTVGVKKYEVEDLLLRVPKIFCSEGYCGKTRAKNKGSSYLPQFQNARKQKIENHYHRRSENKKKQKVLLDQLWKLQLLFWSFYESCWKWRARIRCPLECKSNWICSRDVCWPKPREDYLRGDFDRWNTDKNGIEKNRVWERILKCWCQVSD